MISVLKTVFLFLLMIVHCVGLASVGLQDTIIIGPHFEKAEIGSACYQRTGDPFKKFTLSANGWQRVTSSNISLAADSIQWIFTVLKNSDSADKKLKLHLNHVQTGPVRLYVISGGKTDSSAITGSILPLAQRATTDRMLSLPVTVPAGKSVEIYIKAKRREIGMTFSPVLTDPVLNKNLQWENTAMVVALSSIFIILLAAIMVLFYVPSKESYWFLVYILFGFLYVMAASGYGSLYLWSSFPWFEENAAAFLASLSICGLFQFSKYVLRMDENYPRVSFSLNLFSLLYPAITVIGFALYFDKLKPGFYSGLLNMIYLVLIFYFCAILFISAHEAIVKKQRSYYWFVFIFSFYLLFSVTTILFETDIIEYNYKIHTIILIISSVPQMTLTLLFSINKLVALLKQHVREVVELRTQGERFLLQERLRISRELHDDLGATLSGVAMYSTFTQTQLASSNIIGARRSLDIIKESSTEMVSRLNDMIWLMKPDQSSLAELNEKVEDYARNMAAVKNMQVRFVNNMVSNHPLTFEQRHNIYLLCKEAINNAIKYSEGRELRLIINESDTYIEYIIADDGKGFDLISAKSGNGLKNMRQRAEEIGAVFNIQSAPGKGCVVSLQV